MGQFYVGLKQGSGLGGGPGNRVSPSCRAAGSEPEDLARWGGGRRESLPLASRRPPPLHPKPLLSAVPPTASLTLSHTLGAKELGECGAQGPGPGEHAWQRRGRRGVTVS